MPAIFWYRSPETKIAAAPGFRNQHFILFLNKMYSQFGFVPLFLLLFYLCSVYINNMRVGGILNYTNAIRMINRTVREMDMNAFCCLYESEKKT
jgi:hypothetical protein